MKPTFEPTTRGFFSGGIALKSIQTKITVTILAIFLVALSSLGGLNYWKARSIITENITKDMVNQAEGSAGDIGEWLDARKAELTLIAGNPVVVSGNIEAMIPVLAAAKNSSKSFEIVAYASQNGESVNGGGFKVGVADRLYFKAAINGQPFVSDPLISRASGNPVVNIAVPVKAGDKVVGVLFGSTIMEALNQKVLAVKLGQTGYAFVAQEDGLRIIHPNKEMAMKANSLKDANADAGQKDFTERMVKGEKGISHLSVPGNRRILRLCAGAGNELVTGHQGAGGGGDWRGLSADDDIAGDHRSGADHRGLFSSWFARRIARPIQTWKPRPTGSPAAISR